MYNTDNKHFISALIGDTVRKGITDPKEIVERVAGPYTINGKEIKKNEQSNTDGRRDDKSPSR